MKFIKILQKYKKADEEEIKEFIYRNMSGEMLRGLEHDDPKVIQRALKLFGVDWRAENTKEKKTEGVDDDRF